ncbi:ybaL, partial [Symbiodinium pilosum]
MEVQRMNRFGLLAGIVLIAMVGGATGAVFTRLVPPVIDEERVLRIVDERLAWDRQTQEPLDASIESYLLANPRILERVSEALVAQRDAEQRTKDKEIIEANRQALFYGLGSVIVGNPQGDVTLVEFYDYNCEYCRRAFPDLVELMDADPDLKVVLRQFPILSQGSVDAARVGTLVAEAGGDYWTFHQELFTARGQVDLETALNAAVSIGLDPEVLRTRIETPTADAPLAESFELARALGVTGTPTFVLGDEIIPGAVGTEALRQKVRSDEQDYGYGEYLGSNTELIFSLAAASSSALDQSATTFFIVAQFLSGYFMARERDESAFVLFLLSLRHPPTQYDVGGHVHETDPNEEADDHREGQQRAPASRARSRHVGGDLDDHLRDGAGADAEEERRPLRRIGQAADPDTHHGRGTGQQRQGGEAPERRPCLEDRRGDSDALGHVVHGEAQHQESPQARRAGGEGGTDRQPLAEVVQPDAERDVEREREAHRRAAPAPDGHEQHEAGAGGEQHQQRSLELHRRGCAHLQRFQRHVNQEEREQPDRQRQHEVHAPRTDAAHRRIAQQPDGYRQDANDQSDERLLPEERLRRDRRRHCDRDLVEEGGAGIGHDIDRVRLALHPGIGNGEPDRAAARDGSGRVLGEGPIGVVDLDLGDGHGLRPAGPNQDADAAAVEDRPLVGDGLHRRRTVVEAAQRVGIGDPCDGNAKQHDGQQQPQKEQAVRAVGRLSAPGLGNGHGLALHHVEHSHPAQFGELGLVGVEHVLAGLVVGVAELEDAPLRLGWPLGGSLLFGLALSVASTVVLLKALQDRRLIETERGRIAVGWLIVEDLAMVLALVLIPAIASLGGTDTGIHDPFVSFVESILGTEIGIWGVLALTIVKVAAFVGFMLIVGRRIIPWALHGTAHTGSRELFRLAVLAIGLGVALGSAVLFGVSLARGAFFAGMILSESELSHRAAQETLPLRDAFAVLFFVSVGMLFDPAIIITDPLPVLATVFIIVIGKSLAAFGIVLLFRRPVGTALTISASLAQIGEFSFILATMGVALAILPTEGKDLILAGALISIVFNPLVFWAVDLLKPRFETRFADRKGARGERIEPVEPVEAATGPLTTDLPTQAAVNVGAAGADDDTTAPTTLTDHTVLVGYGQVGRIIADGLKGGGAPVLVIEDSDNDVSAAREAGFEVLFGNAAASDVMRMANIGEARSLMLAISNGFEAGSVCETGRKLNPSILIVARAYSEEEDTYLRGLGANIVIRGEREIGMGMLAY